MSEAAARVVFTTGFSRRYTGGVTEFQVAAKTLRGVIREMDRQFPGLPETLEEETTVAIDGELYEIDFLRPIRPGAEVLFIPKIEGVGIDTLCVTRLRQQSASDTRSVIENRFSPRPSPPGRR